jgi:hypothetical protein
MAPALAVDGRTSTSLPDDYRVPRKLPPRQERRSPLPEDWTIPSDWFEDVSKELERLFDQL